MLDVDRSVYWVQVDPSKLMSSLNDVMLVWFVNVKPVTKYTRPISICRVGSVSPEVGHQGGIVADNV